MGRLMTIKIRKIQKDTYFAFFLSTTIWFTPFRTFAIEAGNILCPGVGEPISKIMVLCFFIYAFIPFCNYVKVARWDLLIILFILFQWFRSLVFHVDYASNYIVILLTFLAKCVPYYFVARNTVNWKLVKQYLYKASTVSIILIGGLTLTKEMWGGGIFRGTDKYSMFYGLLIGRSVIIKCIEFIETRRFRLIPSLALAITLMIFYGTRTPIVCVGFMLFMEFMVFIADCIKNRKVISRYNSWKLALVFAGLIIAGCIFFIIARARSIDTVGPGERILYTISNGEFFKSKGRTSIFGAVGKVILEYPVLGTGIIGDRIAIVKTLEIPIDEFGGYYAHNLFMELILQNGIIIGGLFSILILLLCFNGLFRSPNRDKRLIYIYI